MAYMHVHYLMVDALEKCVGKDTQSIYEIIHIVVINVIWMKYNWMTEYLMINDWVIEYTCVL